ncbi:MAG: ABC transporter ATP-binding protein [Candidatus Diapherotrites archaeon]|nr:ABC transporter ATP-binding protein [Candidatus Diapherotrites archaeon]
MEKKPIIEVQNVSKIYKMDEVDVVALDGVSLKIYPGEFVSIMGPSGSGKTTLLDVLSVLMRPTQGKIIINGKDVSTLNDNELAIIRGKTIGFVFQTFNLIPKLSALENVMMPMWFRGVPLKERKARAEEVLREVGLEDRMTHKPSELSGGQRQRVAIARALANEPEVIVADEPTGNLDSKAGKQVLGILKELNEKQGKTILMVTHNKTIGNLAKRRIKLFDGKICRGDKI